MSVGVDAWSQPTDGDEALTQRFLNGDTAAFDAIYRKYFGRVFTIARGILLSKEDADDATQEAFTKIFENLPRFRGGSRLGTWIFRIAVNSAIQVSRRGKSRRRLSPLDDVAETMAETIDLDDSAKKVHKAMAQLRDEDRAVLTLFYWEELTLAEIGEALGCGGNAAKTRLFRARAKFREVYENEE